MTSRNPYNPFDFHTHDGDGVTWTPWTDGYSVGFKAQHEDGRVRFVMLNPSSGSTDGTPTVFLYESDTDPAEVDGDLGESLTYVAPFG